MFDELKTAISKIESMGADFVESRYDELLIRTIVKENGRFTNLRTIKRSGVGFRVYYGGAMGYSFTTEQSPDLFEIAGKNALGIAKASAPMVTLKSEVNPHKSIIKKHIKPKIREPAWLAEQDLKIDLINRTESIAKEYAKNISSLTVSYGESSGEKMYTDSEGTEIQWNPLNLELRCSITSKTENGDLVTARDNVGGSVGLEMFKKKNYTPEEIASRASIWINEQLNAKLAPAGEFRALCDNILIGVLAHESFGHLTEGDSVVTKNTPIYDKIGEKLGSEHVTIIDEGTPEQSDKVTPYWLPYDDQGIPTTKTVLLQDGILKGFLHTRETAKLSDVSPTGNSRAIDYTFPPIPRMKNTYMEPGDLTEEEALEQLGTGIYAIQTSGGQVESSGDFLFKAIRGYWVENGRKQYPLKDVSLMGNILDLLKKIEGATKDFELRSNFFGGCGKGGQGPLPVGLGGPKVLISNVRFGGELS